MGLKIRLPIKLLRRFWQRLSPEGSVLKAMYQIRELGSLTTKKQIINNLSDICTSPFFGEGLKIQTELVEAWILSPPEMNHDRPQRKQYKTSHFGEKIHCYLYVVQEKKN